MSFGPFCLAAVGTALAGRKLIARYGAPAVIRAGCAISATGTTLLGSALAAQGGSVVIGWLVAGLGIIGAGNSLILTAYLGATLSAVRPDQAGLASGTLNTIQQFAASLGLAVIGAVFFALVGDHPGPAQYAQGTEAVAWISLALVVTMAALTTLLPRKAPPAPQPELSTVPTRARARRWTTRVF